MMLCDQRVSLNLLFNTTAYYRDKTYLCVFMFAITPQMTNRIQSLINLAPQYQSMKARKMFFPYFKLSVYLATKNLSSFIVTHSLKCAGIIPSSLHQCSIVYVDKMARYKALTSITSCSND